MSTWIVLLAVPMLVAVGLAADGAGLLAPPTTREAIALGYMAAVVTTGGLIAWYGSIARLGVERAGLFSAPCRSPRCSPAPMLGHADITPERIAGILVVAAGITAGLMAAPPRSAALGDVDAR